MFHFIVLFVLCMGVVGVYQVQFEFELSCVNV